MVNSRFLSAVIWLLLFNIMSIFAPVFAGEDNHYLWSNSTQSSGDTRVFSEAIFEGGNWVLKIYTQQYGDYQELTLNRTFDNIEMLEDYLQANYPILKRTDNLARWPIVTNHSFKKRNNVLWTVKNDWSEDWEARFARWIQDEVKADFFNKNGLATDCADVLIGLRWIFARNNSLPVANTLGATGDLFTHNSVLRSWRDLSRDDNWNRDRLFMSALNYIMGVTSTRTLIRDSYPIALTTKGLLAGNFILTLGDESNHVKVFSENHFYDSSEIPLYTLSSTTPRSRKDMVREAMLDEEWPKKGIKNFLGLRWPVKNSKGAWYLKKAEEHYNFSTEQYDEDLRVQNPSFIDFLLKRLKPEFSPRRIIEIGVTEIKEYLEMRASVVLKGYEYCKNRDCSQGTSAWDDWSTPSRDHKIATKFDNYEVMLSRYEDLYPGLLSNWKNALKSVDIEILEESVPLSAIRYIWSQNLFSSDPSKAPAIRWGLEHENFFEQILIQLKALLSERDSLLKNTVDRCQNVSCYPKNSFWLSFNSYHIDRDLLDLNSKIRTYCSELATASCYESRDRILSEIIYTSYDSRKAISWLKDAHFLNSAPTVSMASRWDSGFLDRVDLEKFSSVKISENNLALLDGNKLVDLNNEFVLGVSEIGEQIFLTRAGVAVRTPKSGSRLNILYPSNTSWSELDLSAKLGDHYDWNQATMKDTSLGSVLILPSEIRTIIVIFNHALLAKVIELSSEFIELHEDLITYQASASQLGVYQLDSGLIFKLNYSERKIKNPKLIRSLKRFGEFYIGQYSDQNEDLYYPVILDIAGNKVTPIESISRQSKLVFFNPKSLSAVVETEFNTEFPKLIGFNLKNLEVVKAILLGNIVSAHSSEYLLVGNGGKWDQDFDRTLYVATPNGWQRVFKDSPESKLLDLSGDILLSSKSNGDYGELSNLKSGQKVKSAAYMMISTSIRPKSLLMTTSDPRILLTRYSSYMGDYMGYGEVYSLDGSKAPQLLLTSAYPKRDEEESQLQWEARFKNFKVYSGTLVSTGIGLATWIGPIK